MKLNLTFLIATSMSGFPTLEAMGLLQGVIRCCTRRGLMRTNLWRWSAPRWARQEVVSREVTVSIKWHLKGQVSIPDM